MKRFSRFLDQEVKPKAINDTSGLEPYGVRLRYMSDPLEEFDEIEFTTDFEFKNDMAILVTVQNKQIKKVLFGIIGADDPEDIYPLSDDQIKKLLDEKGQKLEGFLNYITA